MTFMRGKPPTPFWSSPSLLPTKMMYELSASTRGIIKSLRRGSGNYARISTYENLHLQNGLEHSLINGFPVLQAYTESVVYDFLAVTAWNKSKGYEYGIHGFGEDKDLESKVWRNVETTVYSVKDCPVFIPPDFSLFIDPWLISFNKAQVFRSATVGAFAQHCGLKVIPLVSWGNVDSFDYCLEHLPQKSWLALSATSCNHCKGAKNLWNYAVTYIAEQLDPLGYVIYGDPNLKMPIDIPLKIIPDFIHSKLRKI